MITTTLNEIAACSPFTDGWRKLLKHLDKTTADDEPLPFATIVASNGIIYAIWCTRAAPEQSKTWKLYALWCARQVQHLMTDPRSIAALDVAERYINGLATHDEMATSYAATNAATAYAAAAYAAAAAVYAADANAAAVYAAYAAYAAANAAADAAAADAAADAAANAAYAAAYDAEMRQLQTEEFLRIVS